MDLTYLDKILGDEPKYRVKQAKETIFKNLTEDWLKATNLSLELRGELAKNCPLEINGKIFSSKDKAAQKAQIILSDGLKVECVLMRHASLPAGRHGGRNTVCVSSQVGCPMKCAFCATGETGFKRNLVPFEIVEQVLFFSRYLKKASPVGLRPRDNERVDNIVFMGMGEPFLNYENVMEAVKILNNHEWGFNIGARHISISTVGIIEGIEKITEEPLQLNLAISLHAPNNILRSKIVPANKKYPIEKIMETVDRYLGKTGRKAMFEYIMIKDFNDSPSHAKELAVLLKKMKSRLWFVNLIPCNENVGFKPSRPEQIKEFIKTLRGLGVNAIQRYRFGDDIKGACGQLSASLK